MLATPQQENIMYLRFLVLILSVFSLPFAAGAADVANLRCEYLKDPLGIRTRKRKYIIFSCCGVASLSRRLFFSSFGDHNG